MKTTELKALLLAGIMSLAALPAFASDDALEAGFRDPPNAARPRVWWHWMNGNVTKEGITADLEWMKRAGIGGFQNFDASLGTPKLVDKRLIFMTPEWKDAFHFAVTKADEMGLEVAIAGSPGWSESGGPWVKPEQAMKKYVWTEIQIDGGKRFKGKLAQPTPAPGPFLDAPPPPELPGMGSVKKPPAFYRDSVVVAFRTPASAKPATATITASAPIDAARLSDASLAQTVDLPQGENDQPAWIRFDYAAPTRVSSLTLAIANPDPNPFSTGGTAPAAILQASDDGASWRDVASTPISGAPQTTLSFPAVTARHFRMAFPTVPLPPMPPFFAALIPKGPPMHRVSELVLHPDARVNRFEDKAAFAHPPELTGYATTPTASADAIAASDVVDVTSKMRPDGSLEWTPPAGRWTVVRIGYSLLGIMNHPAAEEATGLEVDKLNETHVAAYAKAYLDEYRDAAGRGLMGKRGVQYMINDSWEAGAQNWTDDMLDEFQRRRGYDPRPFLPVLTGHVVVSAQASDAFLWDFRKTIAELTADEHYGALTKALHARGMGHYSESHESGRALIADGMDIKRGVDVPMSAMWVGPEPQQAGGDADIRESASVAHIYGQNLVAAESLTTVDVTPWGFSPEMLKPTADRELSSGLNRFVIHTSVHQPLVDRAPGIGLGPFGQWFTRNETWAEQARAWTDYLARSSYMLQQGRFVADVAWFYPEDSNITALYAAAPPAVPEGYQYDYVNAHVVTDVLAVADGKLTTPSGMSYRVLALDPRTRTMSLPVLKRLRDLVGQGAIVVGGKPVASPSQADDPAAFKAMADEVWGAGDADHAFGQGHVYPTGLEKVLAAQTAADFDAGSAAAKLRYVHRRTADADIYFVVNREDRALRVDASFRIDGKAPEIWRADTGAASPASYRIAGGRTTVPLELAPNDAVFVVFRRPATAQAVTIPAPVMVAQSAVDGPWQVAFQPGRGAPASITLAKLASLSSQADPGVKYFSGVATYTTTLKAPKAWFKPGARQVLELGDVKNVAEVSVNGRPLGVAWKRPFQVDATGALKPGDNRIEIKVANLWPNRMIGDKQPGATPVTFSTFDVYAKDSPLQPSGLIGPVTVVVETTPQPK